MRQQIQSEEKLMTGKREIPMEFRQKIEEQLIKARFSAEWVENSIFFSIENRKGVRTPTPIPYVRSKISVKLSYAENKGYEFLRSISARWTEPKPLRDVLEPYIQKNVVPDKHILGFDDSYILLEFAGGWKTITDLLSFIEEYLFENIGVGYRYQEMIDDFFENRVDDES